MGVAGGEKAVWLREARILLDREEQFRHRLIKAPAEEMRACRLYTSDAPIRARGLRRSAASTCSIAMSGWPAHSPENAADGPAAGVVRVERQRTVDQRDHRADVLAEIGQREGGIRQDARVVAGHFEGPPGEIDALQTVRSGVFAPAVKNQPITADRRPGERGPVMRIARDRLLRSDGAPREFAVPTTRPSHRRADRGRRR